MYVCMYVRIDLNEYEFPKCNAMIILLKRKDMNFRQISNSWKIKATKQQFTYGCRHVPCKLKQREPC